MDRNELNERMRKHHPKLHEQLERLDQANIDPKDKMLIRAIIVDMYFATKAWGDELTLDAVVKIARAHNEDMRKFAENGMSINTSSSTFFGKDNFIVALALSVLAAQFGGVAFSIRKDNEASETDYGGGEAPPVVRQH